MASEKAMQWADVLIDQLQSYAVCGIEWRCKELACKALAAEFDRIAVDRDEALKVAATCVVIDSAMSEKTPGGTT